ncbi:MAG: tRNA (adenosine(37)-N6)-threonylcarbamoyltransferase complex ATPase subunit type 1 TsaE [Planctomycetota bacterium]
MRWTIECASPEETEAIGEALGELLCAGDLVDLRGNLGAGKTCLTRGIARGLGSGEPVRSPTFTICQVHRGEPNLFHLDAYRLEEPEELLIQGWDEMRQRGVVVIEWGERVEELLPKDRLEVGLEHRPSADGSLRAGEISPRKLTFHPHGPLSERILSGLVDRGALEAPSLPRERRGD